MERRHLIVRIGPFLITLRITDGRALTSETVADWTVGSIDFGSQGRSRDGNETLPDGHLTRSTLDETPRELGVEAVDEVSL